MVRTLSVILVASLVVAATPAAALKPQRPLFGNRPPVIGPVIEPDIKKPLFPSVAVIDAREPTFTVAVNWYNTSNASSATLWRAIGNSVYSAVTTVSNGSFVATTNTTITDSHPPVDAVVCYKVAVTNNGETASTDAICVLTPDGKKRPLWRAALRVRVADVSNAGTDSAVHVRLNSPAGSPFSPNGNETWIDTPKDDFESDTTRDYELLLSRLGGDVTDVKMISILVEGDDALCIRSLELFLNGQSVFAQDFGSAGRWVSEGNQLTVTSEQLRASPAWQTAPNVVRPTPYPYAAIDAAATAAVGNALHGRDVSFRDTSNNPNTVTTSPNRRVYEWDVTSDGFPVKLQAELLTSTTCVNGTMRGRLFVGAVDADAASWFPILLPLLSGAIVEALEPTFPSLFNEEFSLGPCTADQHLCFMAEGLRTRGGGCTDRMLMIR